MTMQQTRSQTGQSMEARDISDQNSPTQVLATVIGATPQSVKALLLADGWHNVTGGCKIVQFVLGESQSPIVASGGFYTYLQYQEGQRTILTPIRQVLGFDIDIDQSQSGSSGQSGSKGSGSQSGR